MIFGFKIMELACNDCTNLVKSKLKFHFTDRFQRDLDCRPRVRTNSAENTEFGLHNDFSNSRETFDGVREIFRL